MIIKLRRPYTGETMRNYIAYDLETDIAEIVLHNKALLPHCFRILVEHMKRKTSKH